MDKRIAVVTGATKGIGLSIAKTLQKEGYFVIGTYVRDYAQSDLDKLTTEDFVLKRVDASDFEAVKAFSDLVKKEYGGITVLVNNAGIVKDDLLLRMSEDAFDSVLDVNLKGAFNMTKHFSRQLLRAEAASIVNITSVIGLIGNVGQSNYAASKAGLIGFSKSLAKEFASRNVRVNCVAPGFIQTEMTDNLSDAIQEDILNNIALKKLGTVEDVSNAVKFLVSNDAKYITGQTLNVCGGLVL